jgi:hypothetical protein
MRVSQWKPTTGCPRDSEQWTLDISHAVRQLNNDAGNGRIYRLMAYQQYVARTEA